MDPFDRYLRRPIDEMLVVQGVISREKADELAAAAAQADEPYSQVVLDAAILTPWDLARLVAMHYQMPAQPLAGYKFEKSLFDGLRPELLHRHHVVPLAVFGRTRTFAVSEPPTRELLDELTATCGTSLFFYVSEASEISRVLTENVKVVDVTSDSSWHKLFDSAEAEITRGLRPGQ